MNISNICSYNWRLIERENCVVVVVISSSSLLLLLLYGDMRSINSIFAFLYLCSRYWCKVHWFFFQYSAKVVDIFKVISLCVCDFLSWREYFSSSWEWGLAHQFNFLNCKFTHRHTCCLHLRLVAGLLNWFH